MKQILTILFLGLVVMVSATAQVTQKTLEDKAPDAKPFHPMPTVDQILDKYVQALGGKAAVQKLTCEAGWL